MALALQLAELGRGFTSPNPLVGAVIVKEGRILGVGYHKRKGEAHAEVRAIEDAGGKAPGATLYVTLEPHAFYGQTPPCTEAVIRAGIRRVVVGTLDPHPRMRGAGVRVLREAGLEVRVGVLEERVRAQNEVFFKNMEQGLPFVYLKLALTLDGNIASAQGASRWITGELARTWVHKLRGEVDAILVGAGTVQVDDPQLTPRLFCPARLPLRIVLDREGEVSPAAQIFQTPPPTLWVTQNPEVRNRTPEGVEVWVMQPLEIPALLKALYERKGITSLLVEGGAETASSFLPYTDKLLLFYSPRILGEGLKGFRGFSLELSEAFSFEVRDLRTLGEDFLAILVPKQGVKP